MNKDMIAYYEGTTIDCTRAAISNSKVYIREKKSWLIFNQIILHHARLQHGNRLFPSEWKSAVVVPIYKNKGSKTDVNSYRGISVLLPVAKLFEKILAEQIVSYLNEHNILATGQHGFRPGHSCETALHQLISDLNTIRDKKLIAMLLFIDFRKAFDST
jgi:hypothetical protein